MHNLSKLNPTHQDIDFLGVRPNGDYAFTIKKNKGVYTIIKNKEGKVISMKLVPKGRKT